MGRRGPAPKADADRVRRNAVTPMRVVENKIVPAPDKPPESKFWPAQTHKWWDMWTHSPLLAESTAEDWSELADTAMLHAFVWNQDNVGSPAWFKAMSQLRQRTANYGATPLDRQRLRIQFSFADEAEERAAGARERKEARTRSARERRGPLKEAG